VIKRNSVIAGLRLLACRYSASSKEADMLIKRVIDGAEKFFLVLIAGFTVIAMGQEILVLFENGKVALEDLLLMFIFAEVLGMLGAFYARQSNLIMLPLYIAMTALSRLIVLQSKETDLVVLLYESGAILLIAVACWVISRMRTTD
jgi:protein PsiE